jgi:hypothetical protein
MNKQFLADDYEQKDLQRLSQLARQAANGLGNVAVSRAGHSGLAHAAMVRGYLRARRRRDTLFGSAIFADPVWDVLLDLYASKLEARRVCISDACIASSVPSTTALRWLGKMEELKLIVRYQDEADGRRFYVELTERTSVAMGLWLDSLLAELDHADQ